MVWPLDIRLSDSLIGLSQRWWWRTDFNFSMNWSTRWPSGLNHSVSTNVHSLSSDSASNNAYGWVFSCPNLELWYEKTHAVILSCSIHEELQYHCWDESLAGRVYEFWLLFLQECGGQFQLFLKPPRKQMSTHTSCFITWRTSPSKKNFPVPQVFWNKYFALKYEPYPFKIRIPHRKQVHSRRDALSWVCASVGIEWKMYR